MSNQQASTITHQPLITNHRQLITNHQPVANNDQSQPARCEQWSGLTNQLTNQSNNQPTNNLLTLPPFNNQSMNQSTNQSPITSSPSPPSPPIASASAAWLALWTALDSPQAAEIVIGLKLDGVRRECIRWVGEWVVCTDRWVGRLLRGYKGK